jgi:hypothetical protein
MAEVAQKKPIRGYVSSYLKLPLRPLEQAQQEQGTPQTGDPPHEKDKTSKD